MNYPESELPFNGDLGRFQLSSMISKGGMARVYRAMETLQGGAQREVAIKFIRPDQAREDSFRRLFVQEAQVGGRLNHQNLVSIYGLHRHKGVFFLSMEYVRGTTLRSLMTMCKRGGVGLPVSVIAELGLQACQGLAVFHLGSQGSLDLVHRDIKPSNLILNQLGVVKVLDYGITRTQAEGARSATRGTWGYMAPEQSMGKEITARSDLFSLGIVLYELASLKSLFSRKKGEFLDEIQSDLAAKRAAGLTGHYSHLGRVLMRAFQLDPEARYDSAREMAEELKELIAEPIRSRQRLQDFAADLQAGRIPRGEPDTNTQQPYPHPGGMGLPVSIQPGHHRAPQIPESSSPVNPTLQAHSSNPEKRYAARFRRGMGHRVEGILRLALVLVASSVILYVAQSLFFGGV